MLLHRFNHICLPQTRPRISRGCIHVAYSQFRIGSFWKPSVRPRAITVLSNPDQLPLETVLRLRTQHILPYTSIPFKALQTPSLNRNRPIAGLHTGAQGGRGGGNTGTLVERLGIVVSIRSTTLPAAPGRLALRFTLKPKTLNPTG